MPCQENRLTLIRRNPMGLPMGVGQILSYAQEHNLKLTDYSYERGINEDFVDSIDQYITQIDIALEENH